MNVEIIIIMKFPKNLKKILAFSKRMRYSIFCCGMIARKREVAAKWQVFRGANVKLGNWRQVTVRINIYENGSRNNRDQKSKRIKERKRIVK